MTKWAMDAFYSAHFCVEVNLRHKLSHLFSEICQHKELMRGPQSCTHSCSGAAGRSQTSDRVTGQLCGLVRTLFLRCEERRGEEGVFPLISPLSRWQMCWKAPFTLVTCVWLEVYAWLIQGFQWYLWITSGHARGRLRIPPVHHNDYPDDEKCSCSRHQRYLKPQPSMFPSFPSSHVGPAVSEMNQIWDG